MDRPDRQRLKREPIGRGYKTTPPQGGFRMYVKPRLRGVATSRALGAPALASGGIGIT